MKKNLEKRQGKGVLNLLKMEDILETHLPDVRSIAVEPHKVFDKDELPAVGLFLGEELVISRTPSTDTSQEVVERTGDGQFVLKNASRCCNEDTLRRQYFNIEVVVEQCYEEGATLNGVISEMIEECLAGEGYHYDGYFPVRDQQGERSSEFNARQYRFYIEYTKTN